MWLAWGGDAGFSWSRKIVEREKNMKKSLVTNELVEEIKDILEDVVNPVDTVVEIPDDEEITKALRPEVSKEQLGMVIEHLMEAIEGMIEMPEEDDMGSESEDAPEAELEVEEGSANPAPIGDPMKNDVNWPVVKSENGSEYNSDYESDNEEEDKWNNLQKHAGKGISK